MGVAVAFFVLLVLVVASAMVWQHRRYLVTRRDAIQDRQPMLYSRGAFHVLYFAATAPGADVIEAVRAFRRAQGDFAGDWIYAGKGVVTPRSSAQLEPADWSAIVLVQYPSRAAFDEHARSDAMAEARSRFDAFYAHGFERSQFVNLLIPQALLAFRTRQVVTGAPSNFPFEPAADLERGPQAAEIASRLVDAKEFGERAIVVVNLIKAGNSEQRAADRAYTSTMLGAMAEGAYGPVHMGRSVTVEGNADFGTVGMVYYPGVQFFADMARSEFFQSIVGGKQLGDTQVTITVPILDRL